MTDHTEMQIPDDVMEAASEAHANYAKSSVTDNLTVIIARAILAERERCNKRWSEIADSSFALGRKSEVPPWR